MHREQKKHTTMPAPSNLFKVLADDPKALEDEIGCMTGIFQIFDRSQAFTGRRYGSKRVTSTAARLQTVSACESLHHDHNNNPYWMFEDNAPQKVENFKQTKAAVDDDESRDHHRACSDNGDIFTKAFDAPGVVDKHLIDTKDQLDQEFTVSKDLLPVCESEENSASVQDSDKPSLPHHKEYQKLPLLSPRNSSSTAESRTNSKDLHKTPSSDIRDIVRASFHRERLRGSSGKEKPRASVDLSHGAVFSKNLPRSSSVNAQDRFRMSVDGREEARSSLDLPRSSSVDARGSSRMLSDWRTGNLQSSVESPQTALRGKDLSIVGVDGKELPRISVDRNFAKHLSPTVDGKDVTRLMVELKEDSRSSVSKDDHRVFNNGRASPRRPGLNSRYPESRDPSTTTFDFRESLRTADSKDSFRASQKVRDGPRFSVDGTRDPPRASLSPRLSVDGRDSPHACRIPPRLKLDERDSIQSSKLSKGGDASQPKKEYNAAEADGQVETHRRMSNVVARLMGLEALPGSDPSHMISPVKVPETSPSSRDVRLLQGLVEYNTTPKVSPPPPPPPRQSDDYNYKQQETEGFQQLKQRPIQRHDMQLSFMSSSSSSSSQGSSQKETRPQSLYHLHYYGQEMPIQCQSEEGFWTQAEEKPANYPTIKSPLSLSHHLIGGVPPVFKQQDACEAFQEQQLQTTPAQLPAVVLTPLKHTDEEKKDSSSLQEPLYTLMDKEMRQLRIKNSVQGRTMLRHILEAMQLKGLLHSPRRKQSEDIKRTLQTAKPVLEESKSRMQTLKQQFLPAPRLMDAIPKGKNAEAEHQDIAGTEFRKDLPMMETKMHNAELIIDTKQTKSSYAQVSEAIILDNIPDTLDSVQDSGPIMLGNIPDTLIIVPKPTELDPITKEMTFSSPSSAQPADVDSKSSRSGSSERSAVTSSVPTSAEREYVHPRRNGVALKRENGEAAANGRMSQVQTLTSSGSLREPNGLNSSDTEAVTPPRMSRKERIAARSVKGSLDALQVGRDVSPKSPQLSPLPQGKNRLSFPIKEANPLKPGSPRRCVTGNGGPQLVENGKPPSKPFMVKDREDSKPMLLTMRAQSTKQDFLKGRASAGPDSPRPRRSSSDCKLISRMAEKLTATDTAVSSKAQSRRVPSEVAILRSKRSTSKQSTPAVKPRTPSHAEDNQTVPADTSTKEKSNFQNEVKSVAATDGTERDKSNGTNLMIELSQANPPAESRLDLPVPHAVPPENPITENNSVRQAHRVLGSKELPEAPSIQKPRVQITDGEAVDHSEEGGNSHGFSSLQISSPMERLLESEQGAGLDERGISELLTPRGVLVKKWEFVELGPAEVVDQPSPVSVLDNSHFQEEDLTPSQRPSKSSPIDSLEDAFESPQRDHSEEAQAALNGLADIIGCTKDLSNQEFLHLNRQRVEIQLPNDSVPGTDLPSNSHGICLWDKDEEREYVRDILVASGVTDNCLQWTSGYIMDLTHFGDLESNRRHQQQPSNTKENDAHYERLQTCSEKEALGRRVLFDATNEILVEKLDPVKFIPLPWIGRDQPQLQQKPARQHQLVQEIWDELQHVPCVQSEDVCDTLYTILLKDLHKTAKQWTGMDGELGKISLEVERMIVKELIEEIVKDLASGFCSSCHLSTKPIEPVARRQLFAP